MKNIQFTSFFKDSKEAFFQYQYQGFHIEEDVLSPFMCEQLIIESHQLDNALNGSYRPSMMPHKTHPLFFSIMKNEKIIFIMETLVGGKVSGIQSEMFFCKPGTPGFSAHQDNFFVQAPQNNFASAWIALVDVTPQSGGLIVYPGSHQEGALPVQEFDKKEYASQDPNARKTDAIIPDKYQPFSTSIKKGSVIFIHGHTVHASNNNQSNYHRYVLLNTYIKRGVNFRAGQYAGREEIPLDRDEGLKILG